MKVSLCRSIAFFTEQFSGLTDDLIPPKGWKSTAAEEGAEITDKNTQGPFQDSPLLMKGSNL